MGKSIWTLAKSTSAAKYVRFAFPSSPSLGTFGVFPAPADSRGQLGYASSKATIRFTNTVTRIVQLRHSFSSSLFSRLVLSEFPILAFVFERQSAFIFLLFLCLIDNVYFNNPHHFYSVSSATLLDFPGSSAHISIL